MSSSVQKASKMISGEKKKKKRPETARSKFVKPRAKSKLKPKNTQEKKFKKMLNQRAKQLGRSKTPEE
jgi:hypothetical protein